MSLSWIDISLPLDPHLATWPGSPGVHTTSLMSIARGDVANVTQLTMDVHSGTHVDAPYHFVADGALVDELGLAPFIGPALVIDTHSTRELDADTLAATAIPTGTERLIFRTVNSQDGARAPFRDDYAGLTLSGAEWLVDNCDLKLVGIDYLSIQRYTEPPDVHRTLLGSGLAILEGLDLINVAPGSYELLCLPLKLVGTEGAPARALLLPSSPGSGR
jgi:arylformamidase